MRGTGFRERRGEILFIDARKLGRMVDRTHRELTGEDVARIAGTYHAWRGGTDRGTGVSPVTNNAIRKRQGAYLPHWTKEGATYSVVFRLADSLPRAVLERFLFEREAIVKTAKQMKRPLTEKEEKRLAQLYSENVESYLDAGHGACWLRQDKVAGSVADALSHFDGQRYRLAAWCVMPNHVHVIVTPLSGHSLEGILHSWKSFTAKEANKLLGRTGSFWQAESFDHLIRDEQEFVHAVEYVLNNPAKAGLSDWKWVSGPSGGMSRGTGVSLVSSGVPSTPEQDTQARVRHGRDAHATYRDVAGFCKSAQLEEVRKHGHVLTPGRYVGAEAQADDGEPFEEKMQRFTATLRKQQAEAAKLDAAIAANLKELGYGG